MRRGGAFRVARTVHAWAGAAVAGVLFVLSVSGTLLVLKADYLRLTVPEARTERSLDPGALGAVMASAEARYGGELRAVVFAEPGFGLHQAYLADGGAYLGEGGAVVAEWRGHGRPEAWLTALHHDLTVGRTGRAVSGIVGIATVLLVVCGLVAYWPMRRGLRRGFRADGLERRELRSLHRNLGLTAALPTVILAVTGAAMSFPSATKAVMTGGAEAAIPAASVALPDAAGDWKTSLMAAEAAFPGAAPRLALSSADGARMIRLRQEAEWHPNGRTVVAFAPGGAAASMVDAQALRAGERAFNAIYPVHAVHVGGRVADALAVAGGAALSLLTGVGLLSFLARLRIVGPAWHRLRSASHAVS